MQLIPLGPIVRLQIQRSPLKVGEKPNRVYSPAPILAVERLTLTTHGAIAPLPDGTRLLDVHHLDHPQTRNRGKGNALSIGFTAHYALMSKQFGERVATGCAGENILVQTERRVELAEIEKGLAIQTASGALVPLNGVMVATPCKPFTGYLLGGTVDSETFKRSLQFLDHGTRGYYCSLAASEPVTIALGDTLLAVVDAAM